MNFWDEEFFGMSSYTCENFQLFILYNFQFHHMVLKRLPEDINSFFDFLGGGVSFFLVVVLVVSWFLSKLLISWLKNVKMKIKSPRSDWVLWTPDSNAHEALGYRLTFVRSEVSATDSNSLMLDGRVHIVYKYVEGLSRLKQKSKRPWPPAQEADWRGGGIILLYF